MLAMHVVLPETDAYWRLTPARPGGLFCTRMVDALAAACTCKISSRMGGTGCPHWNICGDNAGRKKPLDLDSGWSMPIVPMQFQLQCLCPGRVQTSCPMNIK